VSLKDIQLLQALSSGICLQHDDEHQTAYHVGS